MAQTARLKLQNIKYLALEGGGGKGFAYLGALQMLEKNKDKTGYHVDIDVLDRLQGVAGTSAGAITALMIAVGMGSEEIRQEIAHPTGLESFDDFFDPSSPRYIPQPFGYVKRTDNELETTLLAQGKRLEQDKIYDKFRDFVEVKGKATNDYLSGLLSSMGGLAGFYFANYLANAEKTFERYLKKAKPLVNVLFLDQAYRVYAIRDMGFFSGYRARKYFDDLIAAQCAKATGGPIWQYTNLTFAKHQRLTQKLRHMRGVRGAPAIRFKDLMVCGANLSTGQSQLFSARHTPNFPLADAVRLSMSLPLIYKPYVISTQQRGWPACGTYIDGGWWNNIPFRDVSPDGSIAKTLALRLEIDEPKMICTAFDMELAILSNLLGSGESQITPEFAANTIILDTDQLSLLDFSPEQEVQDIVTRRSRRTVCRYFGWKIDQADEDAKDDERIKKSLSKTACGQCPDSVGTAMTQLFG